MRVALVYDRINKIGGAEQILIALSQMYPHATWFTSFWDPAFASFSRNWIIKSSWLSKIPLLKNHHEWFPYLMPFIFENFDFRGFDLVISVSSAEAKGIITSHNTLHINYCLTPTRYLYSHASLYLSNPLFRKIGSILKKWDLVAASRPDQMIAISEHVKKRIKKYYNRDSVVIYPPVTAPFLTSEARFSPALPQSVLVQGYFLVVSRLVKYKQIDILIKAANLAHINLVIIGEGEDLSRLRSLAGPTVFLLGFVNTRDLPLYYANCLAYLQGNIEDFGISMCESLLSGKPVIAYGEGGAQEIVIPGKNGILVKEHTAAAFAKVLAEFGTMSFVSADCVLSAKRFDKSNWNTHFKERIDTLCQLYQK